MPALWKVQAILALNDHHALAVDGNDCAHLGKSVGKKGFTLLAAEHLGPLQHMNF